MKDFTFRASIACQLLCFALCLHLLPQRVAEAVPPTGNKHVYKTIDGRDLKIYVTKPADWKKTDKSPAIVFFHGGGWTGGAPGQFTEHSQYLADRGMVAFQVEYRLLNRKASDPPETCVADATDALRWVRSKADEFGIDPDRVATGGGSAGGHLAAYLGCISSKSDGSTISAKANAMALFNPVYDNGPKGWGTKRVGDRYPEFSPFHNVSKDDPPNIVFLGSKDNLIPVATAEAFQKAMREAGVKSELHVYEGQGHGFFNSNRDGGKWYKKTIVETDKFFVSLGWIEKQTTK